MCGGSIVSANLRILPSVDGGSLKSCPNALGLRPIYYGRLANEQVALNTIRIRGQGGSLQIIHRSEVRLLIYTRLHQAGT